MGSTPAQFTTLIKDHKKKTETGYPLRPLASTINTPTDKLDWLVSKILNQCLQFIPSYLKNTDELIEKLNNMNKKLLTSDHIFISLDVVNLYPSIPINEGIASVMNFAESIWTKIDSFGFSLTELSRCLSFLAYNSEIIFDDKVYLQTKGCPMGSHFSPPFAIIFMHVIEQKALEILHHSLHFDPILYVRFIDDILIGPVIRNNDFCNMILETFNSINKHIKFTVEIPGVDEPISFLDLSIFTCNNDIKYSWYRKACHSGILLRADSNLPYHTKTNYIYNTFRTIEKRCSTQELQIEKKKEFEDLLIKNGYKEEHVSKFKTIPKKFNSTKKQHFNIKNKVPLFLNFISDQANYKIRNAIHKYDLDINLISKPAPQLSTLLKTKTNNQNQNHENCEICPLLNKKFKCYMRYIIYKMICKICKKFYIGQTNRPFMYRYKEHKYSLTKEDGVSALSEHASLEHSEVRMGIADFDVQFIEVCKGPIDCIIAEAKNIDRMRPQLNRKQELRHW